MSEKEIEKLHDFAIVINGELNSQVNTFIQNLTKSGLQIQFATGQKVERTFILLSIPQKVLTNYAKVFNVVAIGRQRRRPGFLSVEGNFIYSSAQKLLVLTRLLESTSFGPEKGNFGLTRLIKLNLIETAYPLHDGPYNDYRESMRKTIWKKWTKTRIVQPLDDIQQYFGWEIGFYFAWMEFFIKLLIPASIIGIIVFVIGLIIESATNVTPIKEICEEDNIFICPICDYKQSCIFRPLSSYCFYALWTYAFDNYFTIIFAVGMSFWATILLRFWKRKELVLKYRWDAEFEEIESEPRPAYLYSHNVPNYVDRCLRKIFSKQFTLRNISLTVSTVLCLFVAMCASYLGIIAYRIPMTRFLTGHSIYDEFLASIIASLVLVAFIRVFDRIFYKLSIYLTDLENQKYQRIYDKSALYKRFLLSFANNFSFLFYIAFAKGRFFSTPLAKNLSFMARDTCQPFSCILSLSIQLGLLMLLKRFIWNLCLLIYLEIRLIWKKKKNDPELIPQYEKDYHLQVIGENFFLYNFCESIIEYGHVTFFVAALPLAPFLALMNNLILIRVKTIQIGSRVRRPIPRKVCGIAEWNGILLGLTYLSTATNAFVTAFTSDFIWKELYSSKYDSSLKGYINSTLSSFLTNDSAIYSGIEDKVDVCFYKGLRNPHDSHNKYEKSGDMWLNLAWRFMHVFIFEHFIFGCNAVLAYFIPIMPYHVREQKTLDKQIANKVKWSQMSEKEKTLKRKFLQID